MNASFRNIIQYHGPALVIFVALATLFLWEVLFLGYSLGAFDIILNQPSWKSEFVFKGIHQPILSDSPAAHYPQREFDWGHARQLTNPEYNPYIFTGIPWSAQGVGAFITSLPQLFLGVKNALDWSTWVRLVCAGFFMYLLILELGLSRAAGVFAGVLWAYNLHQVVWLEFPQHLATQLWIPLVFLFNTRVLSRGWDTLAVIGLLLVNVFFFTSGYMQIVLYTYVAVGVFNTVYVLVHAGTGQTGRYALRWCGVHAVFVAAVALCAAGLLAEVQSLSEGLRGAQDWRGRVETPGLSVASLKDLLLSFVPRLSEVTHLLTPHYYGGFWEGRYSFENGNIVETSRYFGALGVLFVVAALFATWRTRHFRLVAIIAVVMALIFSMIYRNEFTISALRLIPFADKGSYSRFITLLTFFGCVLAGCGLQYALGGRIRAVFIAMTVVAACVVAAWVYMDDLALGRFWYTALLFGLLGAALIVRHFLRLDWKWVGVAVIVVSTADLLSAGYGFNTRMENEKLFPRNNTIRYLASDPEPYRVAVISDKPLYHPNILSYYDIPVVEGYWTVLPVDYATYVKELFPESHITKNGILFLLEPNVEALRLLNVKYVLSDRRLDEEHEGLERVIKSNNHWIFRVVEHLPRVFCASDVVFHDDEAGIMDHYQDLLGNYDEPLVLSGPNEHRRYEGECRVLDLEVFTQGLEATVETDATRYLVVPYAFNGNWGVTLNGREGDILKANGYHMAVEIPAGTTRLELRYANGLNRVAAGIFIVAAGGLLVLAWMLKAAPLPARVVLGFAAIVIIVKSSFSLPPIRDNRVPERLVPDDIAPVYEQGVTRTQRAGHSERVTRANAVELPLGVAARGLTRLSLLAGTFHQPRLTHPIQVEILDATGEVLVSRRVAGRDVVNNSWFSIEFPALRRDTRLRVRVSTREEDRSKSFILWLNEDGRLCVQAFYQPASDLPSS